MSPAEPALSEPSGRPPAVGVTDLGERGLAFSEKPRGVVIGLTRPIELPTS